MIHNLLVQYRANSLLIFSYHCFCKMYLRNDFTHTVILSTNGKSNSSHNNYWNANSKRVHEKFDKHHNIAHHLRNTQKEKFLQIIISHTTINAIIHTITLSFKRKRGQMSFLRAIAVFVSTAPFTVVIISEYWLRCVAFGNAGWLPRQLRTGEQLFHWKERCGECNRINVYCIYCTDLCVQ